MSAKGPASGILTFLIADIRGYTTFTQQRGDEAAGRLAARFADICREGIEAHGGELTELRGDEALAVFSSPRAALRAAADLQAVFADESAVDPELPLPVGIGLDAGEAVAVAGGYRGGALNLAARLCSKAAAGEVLVSQGVAHLARAVDGIRLEDHGRLEMKGLAEPVQVFRLQAGPAISVTSGAVQEPPPELVSVTPIFGRESELSRLRWMWRMARRGTVRVVAVAGPAGIGKTRLLAELAATVAAGGGQTTYRSFAVNTADELGTLTNGGVAGLTVFDDLECAQPDDLRRITEQLSHVDSRLVALAFNDDESSHELLTAAHALSGGGEGFIRPQPLDIEQMLRIASLYVGSAADTLPRDLLTATGGMPRKVHEAVSGWAHVQASRRLGVLANQAASDRGGLRAVEADLAGTVIDLQTVREQTRLYRVGPGRHAPEPAASPYRGLASFDVSDVEHFFGRERLVAELVSRLAGAPLLGVIGPSGSGKSSAVRAGLIPALSMGVLPGSEKWTIALLRPGEHPLRAMEHAVYRSLPRATLDRMGAADAPLVAVRDVLEPDTRLVLVIDQFEEAFTAVNDAAERDAFLAATAAAAADPRGGVVVILAIRADFYGRCAAHAGLAELLAANHVLVGPMTSAEYRRAIVQPALRVGVEVERELVDDLVGEVVGEPGALPLLSTTLLELWDRRDGRAIRRQAYLATGGVRGAVARLAEDVYGTFDEARQATARSILLRLAGPGEGESVVRRRVALAEFDAERNPMAAHVLEVFADRRLVTISDGTVEVAHEALLREWPRLQDWLDEDREGRRLRQHLITASRDWVDSGKDPGELYRGARLSAALDWTTEHTVELNEVERDFVTTSRAQNQSDLIRQRRQNRRLRGLLGGVAALLILALAAGGLALVQSRSAQDQARLALARQLGSEAVSAPRIDEAMLLARQAVLLDNSSQTKSTLLATLLRSPAVVGTFAMPLGLRPLALALSPDGGKLAVTENNGEIRFFDTATNRESGPRLADYGGLPGGTVLYSGTHFIAPNTPSDGSTPTLDVFDAQTMHRIRSLQFTPDFVRLGTGPFDPVVTSPDGNSVYFAWTLVNNDGSDGPAYVDSWDLISGAHRLVSLGANGIAAAAALPGNRLLVVTDSAVLTLDAATLHVLHSMPESLGPTLVAISPDGRTVAAATGASSAPGNTFVLLDLASGRRTLAGSVHTAPLDRLTFTPDGRSVVSTGEDARVVVWDASTGAPTQILNGHSGRVVGEATDGKTLYTSSLDGVVFAWDLGDTRRFGQPFDASSSGPLQLPPSLAPALALSPDSSRFGVRTGVGTVGLFDARTLTLTSTLAIGPDAVALAWSADNQLAVATDAGGIQLWDVHATPTRGRDLSGVTGTIQAVAFSPNARTVAAVTRVRQPASSPGASAGELGIWDRASGRLLQQLHPGVTDLAVAFDPTGRRVAVGTGLGKVVVVDVSSGRNERTLNLATAAIQPMPVWAVAWNGPDTLLTGNNAGIVQHWDVRSGVAIGHAVLAEAAPVSSITVSPDGTLFATSGGSSGDLKIWDDSSLQQVGTSFPGSPGLWGSAAYTPDGSKLIVVYGDGSGAVWPVSLNAWMNHACAVAKRNFTREEWARFVPGHDYAQTCAQYPAGV